MVLGGDGFRRSCETDDRHRKTGGSRSWPWIRPAGPEKNGQLSLNKPEKGKKEIFIFSRYFSSLPSSAYLLAVATWVAKMNDKKKKNLHKASMEGCSIEFCGWNILSFILFFWWIHSSDYFLPLMSLSLPWIFSRHFKCNSATDA